MPIPSIATSPVSRCAAGTVGKPGVERERAARARALEIQQELVPPPRRRRDDEQHAIALLLARDRASCR